MKKEIRDIDKKRGIVQVTTVDERVYVFPTKDKSTGLPTYKFKPSSTYILAVGYPKGKFFTDWLMKNGNEAEQIKIAAGERGSKIHQAIESLFAGSEVEMDAEFINPTTKQRESLSVEEYEGLLAFARWWDDLNSKKKVEVLGVEFTVDSDKHDYAGTVDLLLKIDDEIWIVDAKTGQNLYEDHTLQVSSYKHALMEKEKEYENIRLGIVQIGYRKNQKGYKFTEVQDKFEVFLHAKGIFHNEVSRLPYKQVEYPLSVKITV